MRRHRFATRRRQPRRGAIVVLLAVLLPALVIVVSFGIDVAWMQLVRTELRTATDAASRAAAKTLSMEQDQDLARAAAVASAEENNIAGDGLTLAEADVEFGSSDQADDNSRFVFVPGGEPLNAVRVVGRRTTVSVDGPVALFFGGVLGMEWFEPEMAATSTMLDRDICIVVDRSGSMGLDIDYSGTGNGQNCGPLDPDTRFVGLANSIEIFLGELELTFPDEQVALVSYSSSFSTRCSGSRLRYNTTETHQELTEDFSAISAEMNSMIQNGIGGSTAIGEGLREGIAAMEDSRPYAIKTIILMTDGVHNYGVDPEDVAPEASDADITVHTITFSPNADISRMEEVAQITGGNHYHADTAEDLSETFREIARTLPVMITN